MSSENKSVVTLFDGASSNHHHPWTEGARVISLVHPHSNQQQHFILSSDEEIYEMTSIARPYASFFVGSRVLSNGALHVVTRMDPLYFLLHSLSSSEKQQWQPLDQLDIPTILQKALSDENQYKHVCAVKKLGDDLVLYKFSEKKTLEWLVKKQEAAFHVVKQQFLEHKRSNKAATQKLMSEGGGAFSNTFHMVEDDDTRNTASKASGVTTLNDNNTTTTDTSTESSELTTMELKAAKEASVQIVCEYLSSEWQTKLKCHVGMTIESSKESTTTNEKNDNAESTNKRSRACWEASNPGQNDADDLLQFTMGTSGSSKDELSSSNKKEPAKSAGLKRLAKVNTKGMKSLSSFFGAAAKKKKTTCGKD